MAAVVKHTSSFLTKISGDLAPKNSILLLISLEKTQNINAALFLFRKLLIELCYESLDPLGDCIVLFDNNRCSPCTVFKALYFRESKFSRIRHLDQIGHL